jgi:hypothetical protein
MSVLLQKSPEAQFSRGSTIAAAIGFLILILAGYTAAWLLVGEITPLQAITLRITVGLSSAGLIACAITLIPVISTTSTLAKLVSSICILWMAAFSYVALPIDENRRESAVVNRPVQVSPSAIDQKGIVEPPTKDQRNILTPPETFDSHGPQVRAVPRQGRNPNFERQTRPRLTLGEESTVRLASLVPKGIEPTASRIVVAVLERGQQENVQFCETLFTSRTTGIVAFLSSIWRSSSEVVWYDMRRPNEIGELKSRVNLTTCWDLLDHFDYDRSRAYLSGRSTIGRSGPWLVAIDSGAKVTISLDFSVYPPDQIDAAVDKFVAAAEHLRTRDSNAVAKLEMEYFQEAKVGAFAITTDDVIDKQQRRF